MSSGVALPEVEYPESDGEPMAENTIQYDWIVKIKGGLEDVFADAADVFIAADLFWYPVRGEPETRLAPDTMVVFGRPKGPRGSYRQWEEGGIAPQVVFEVLSPSNRAGEMERKRRFYERFGVQEYYVYDPDDFDLTGYRRQGDRLEPITSMDGFASPLLGITFDKSQGELRVRRPDGAYFQTFEEVSQDRRDARLQAALAEEKAESERRFADIAATKAKEERERAEREQKRAERERERADAAEAKAALLEAKLRQLGLVAD